MNNLNQILIEGKVSDVVVETGSEFTFFIMSCRYIRNEDKNAQATFEEKSVVFKIRTYAELAKHCSLNLKAGREVRIIGRLDRDGNDFYIVADHVIYKPELKQGKPETAA